MIKKSSTRNGTTKVTFTLPPDEPPGAVSVVGTFNDWLPGAHELVQRKNGTRSVSLNLPRGTHRFRYLAAAGIWRDDEEADHVDEHGSVITI